MILIPEFKERRKPLFSAFWKDEKRVRNYIPDYVFKNWRQLHKKYALEEFLFNPWTGEKDSVFILVNFEEMRLTRIETNAIIYEPSVETTRNLEN